MKVSGSDDSIAADSNGMTANSVNSLMFSTDDAILVPGMSADLPNEEEGSIIWWTKPEMSIFKEFKGMKKFLVMYVSKRLNGLVIAYDFDDENLVGGTPLMHTPKINFFDGKPHQIAYTFKKGGLQAIYFDGTKLAETAYRELVLDSVSGFAVHSVDADALPSAAKEGIGDEAIYDKALSEDELKALMH